MIFLTFVTAAIYVVSPVRFVSRIDSVSPIYREIFLLIQFLVYLSLLVRRLHDTGRKLWKEFFRPITFSFLLLIGTSLLYNIFFNDLVGFAFEIAFLAFIYYIVKTSIFASYVEEERTDNEYGVAIIPDSNKITKIVCMISIHVILVTFLWGIILSFIF